MYRVVQPNPGGGGPLAIFHEGIFEYAHANKIIGSLHSEGNDAFSVGWPMGTEDIRRVINSYLEANKENFGYVRKVEESNNGYRVFVDTATTLANMRKVSKLLKTESIDIATVRYGYCPTCSGEENLVRAKVPIETMRELLGEGVL